MAKTVDVPALERFKTEQRQRLAGEWQTRQHQAESRAVDLERQRAGLASACQRLGEDLNDQQDKTVDQHNRAEAWKLAALASLCLIPVAVAVLRFFGG